MPDGPHASATDIRYGGFWIRAAARILDILIIVTILNVFYLLDRLGADTGLWSAAEIAGNHIPEGRISATNVLRGVFFLGFPLFYYVYLHGACGQTFGKMAAHIRVVNLDGSPIDYRKALMRSLMEIFLSFILGFFIIVTVLVVGSLVEYLSSKVSLIGSLIEPAYKWFMVFILLVLSPGAVFVWALLDSKKQGLHDKACGTIVVRTNAHAERPPGPATSEATTHADTTSPSVPPTPPAAPAPPEAPPRH